MFLKQTLGRDICKNTYGEKRSDRKQRQSKLKKSVTINSTEIKEQKFLFISCHLSRIWDFGIFWGFKKKLAAFNCVNCESDVPAQLAVKFSLGLEDEKSMSRGLCKEPKMRECHNQNSIKADGKAWKWGRKLWEKKARARTFLPKLRTSCWSFQLLICKPIPPQRRF